MRAAVVTAKENRSKKLELDCRPRVLGFYIHFADKQGLPVTKEEAGHYSNGDERIYISYGIDQKPKDTL